MKELFDILLSTLVSSNQAFLQVVLTADSNTSSNWLEETSVSRIQNMNLRCQGWSVDGGKGGVKLLAAARCEEPGDLRRGLNPTEHF